MTYPLNFEQKIGFDKVRNLIAHHCLSKPAADMVADMTFSSDYETVVTKLSQTRDFKQIITSKDDFPADGFLDVRDALKKTRIEGSFVTEKELFDIRRSLEAINAVLKFFKSKKTEHSDEYPFLQALAADVADFPHISKQIDAVIDKFGQILSNASPELSDIRNQMTLTENRIARTLSGILRAAQAEGMIDKDVAPAVRNGRLVIPVAPAFKRKIRGIIHDESATGKTVFIEPQEVVEANNRIRELESREKREIVRILTAITGVIRNEINDITDSYEFLAKIDFIRAKAIFALEVNATMPLIENDRLFNWTGAVHPLLLISHKKQGKPVVPLDLNLDARILLVSGPNAGGKSVLLKTVGLLQYMLQTGLLIPVKESSKAGIFDDIFIDIGDEQSIEDDLSTYSSHLSNMKFMLKNASHRSLILIDEFGSGTEPQIGVAIAETILNRFNETGCFGVITTHYQNLKTYAGEHEGIVNGAMLYDRQEMQPLFQLSIGNAGSSFAIEIARKIGLPENVIAGASEKVGQDYINLDRYLQDIVRDKKYWEKKRQQIRLQEKRLEETEKQYMDKLETFESEKRKWLAEANANAKKILTEANAKIEKAIREIREVQAEKEKTRVIRKDLDDFKRKVIKEPAADGKDTPNRVFKNKKQEVKTTDGGLSVGDTVRLKGQRAGGVIVDRKDNFYIVAFGSIKTNAKAEQLEKISKGEAKEKILARHSKPASYNSQESGKKNFNTEIDLRGMFGDEALQAVTYYIDDAIRYSAGRVRILHGTGTGALRQIVRDYLKTVDGVGHFGDEHVQFGGAGITVVDLE
ncbi:MAG: endonuclease MutS2 [Dysgonamonadaceae bacterium]|jgi:DNA mismatch repair protein MutS2|nr:endonuclease MutS2 [Dysgonamonadaceae bacterium]